MRTLRPLLAALFVLVVSPLAGAETVTLDAERRAALAELPVLHGPALNADTLDGRVVVVAFFASWCPPCHPEFDHLNEAHRAFRSDGVEIVAVNIFEDIGRFKDDPERLGRFLARKAPTFHVLGGGEAVADLFGSVDRIPTVFVFGPDGRPSLPFHTCARRHQDPRLLRGTGRGHPRRTSEIVVLGGSARVRCVLWLGPGADQTDGTFTSLIFRYLRNRWRATPDDSLSHPGPSRAIYACPKPFFSHLQQEKASVMPRYVVG